MIHLTDISKVYQIGSTNIEALKGITLDVNKGEFISIIGPSGSGKSTLLNIIGCLDRPTSGIYLYKGKETNKLTDKEFAKIRNREIGFIFQSFNLLWYETALQNVMLPLLYRQESMNGKKELAIECLRRVGLQDRLKHTPSQLSGGEQQRVAIARALVKNPEIILADEPTGNLDTESGIIILEIFKELNKKGMTIIIITHEKEVADHSDRIIFLRDGILVK